MFPFMIIFDDSRRSLEELSEETAIDTDLFFDLFAQELGKTVGNLTPDERTRAEEMLQAEKDLNGSLNVALSRANEAAGQEEFLVAFAKRLRSIGDES